MRDRNTHYMCDMQEKEKQENKLDTLSFLYNAQAEPYCLKLINKQGAHSMYTVATFKNGQFSLSDRGL